jgi:hypothetical protein
MSFDATKNLQQAVYAVLTADTALMALVTGVIDVATRNAILPYITVGEDTARPLVTKTGFHQEILFTVSVWSAAQGRAESKTIVGEVVRILHDAPLTVSGYTCVSLAYVGSDSRMPAEKILRADIRFRAVIAG